MKIGRSNKAANKTQVVVLTADADFEQQTRPVLDGTAILTGALVGTITQELVQEVAAGFEMETLVGAGRGAGLDVVASDGGIELGHCRRVVLFGHGCGF